MSLTHVVDIPVKKWLLARSLNLSRYSATSLFQPFPTDQDEVTLIKFDEENRAAKIFDLQSNGDAESVTVKFEYTKDNVSAKVISVRTFISTKDIRNASDPILNNHEKALMMNLMKMLMVHREKDAVDLATDGSKYNGNTTTLLTTAKWSASGTPYQDLATWGENVSKNSEEDTNFLFLSYDVFKLLANHTDTIDRLPTIKEKVLTIDALRKLLSNDVGMQPDKIVVGRATFNDSKTSTKDMKYFWENCAILGYQNPDSKNMLLQQTYGQMFYPKGFDAVKIFKYTKPELRGGYYLEVELAYTFKITSSDCGFFATGLNT